MGLTSRPAGIENIEVAFGVFEGDRPSLWSCAHENSALSVSVAQGKAVFSFKHPVYSLEAAVKRAEEFVRSWDGDLLLQTGSVRRELRMESVGAPSEGTMVYGPIITANFGGPQMEANIRRLTPWRRHRYYDDELIASLIERYEGYRGGRERLAVVGYLCLTALTTAFGGKKEVADLCCMQEKIVSRLFELVSTVGTYSSARKISRKHQLREFAEGEAYWMERVLHELIRRAGEVRAGRSELEQLLLSDLPQI